MTLTEIQILLMEIATEARSLRTDFAAIDHILDRRNPHTRRPTRKVPFRCPQTR